MDLANEWRIYVGGPPSRASQKQHERMATAQRGDPTPVVNEEGNMEEEAQGRHVSPAHEERLGAPQARSPSRSPIFDLPFPVALESIGDDEEVLTMSDEASPKRGAATAQRGDPTPDANDDWATQLFEAASQGFCKDVEELLAKDGVDVNAVDTNGCTPLLLATREGHLKVVQTLLARGINPNAANDDGVTALQSAASEGYLAIVAALLTMPNIDPNLPNADGETALMQTAQQGHAHVVQALLAHDGIWVNAMDAGGFTALMMAAEAGHAATVAALLKARSIKVNTATAEGCTALVLAAQEGHRDVVRYLLDVPGIAVNACTVKGATSLLLAVEVPSCA